MNRLYLIISLLDFIWNALAQRFVPIPVPQNSLVTCQTPLGDAGQCVSLKVCQEVLVIFRALQRNRATEYSRELQRRCGNQITHDNYPIVCCTSTPYVSIASTTMSAISTTTTYATTERTKTQSDEVETLVKSLGEPCEDPDMRHGTCKRLPDCPALFDGLKENPSNETLITYIKTSHAKCGSVGRNVCCALTISQRDISNKGGNVKPKTLPLENDGCGLTHQVLPKIVGGEVSEIGTWPWMTLLGYGNQSAPSFKCGGTLITVAHVLTAAHCLEPDLHFVRLGEFDLSVENETEYINVNVEKVVAHLNFSRRTMRYDIAVLYLEKAVEITEFISPICLPVAKELLNKNYVNYNPFVSGWGKTSFGGIGSNVLRQAQIQIYNTSVCRNVYTMKSSRLLPEYFDETILCAGSLEGETDSCRGDSGGPLMCPELYNGKYHFYLLGVVSYGIRCAEVGVPGIYTKVQYFVDWIAQRVAESS